MKRIKVLTMAGVMVVGLVFSTIPAFTQEKITLTFWMHDHPPLRDLIQNKIIPKFEKEHPDVEVKLSVAAASLGAVHEKLLVSYLGGASPDTFIESNNYLPQDMFLKMLDVINPEVFGVDSYEELARQWSGGIEMAEWGGKYYGVPLSFACLVTVINTTHFREVGLDPDKQYPITWVEGDRSVAKIGQKLTQRENGKIIRKGYGISTFAPFSLTNFNTRIHQLGGRVIAEDGKTSLINSSAGVKVLSTLQDFVYKYKISLPTGTGRSAHRRPEFQSGEASMISTIYAWYRALLETMYPDLYKGGKGIKFIPMPVFKDGAPYYTRFGSFYGVNSESKHKKESWQFLKSLCDHDAEHIELGNFMTRKGWAETQAAKNLPDIELWKRLDKMPGGFVLSTTNMQNIVNKAITSVLFEKMDAKKALDIAKEEIEDYLDRLPYKGVPVGG